MSSVWIVSGSEYDDHGPMAAFTTQELAEAYAAPKGFTVDEFTVHDRLPTLVTLHVHSATVLGDGTVQRGGCHSQQFWDSETPEPVTIVRGSQGTQVIAWSESAGSAGLACLEEVKGILGAAYEEHEHSVEWLVAAIKDAAQQVLQLAYVPPRQVCYDASFGRVHVRSSCRCPQKG